MAHDRSKNQMKILLIGEKGVGKTCLMVRFIQDNFFENEKVTIGVNVQKKTLNIDGVMLDITICDTAGEERFRTVAPSYYRNAQGAILVYDVTKKNTLYKLESWLNELDNYGTYDNMVKIIVGSQIDQPNRTISMDEAFRFARNHHIMFTEASAKTGEGVKDAFEEVVRKIMESDGLWDQHKDRGDVDLSNNRAPAQNSCAC